MALSIKDPETDRIVRDLAAVTGESMTVALRCAALPILDERSEDEILGYDDDGLPGR